MNYLIFIFKNKLLILVLLFISINSFSQHEGSKLYELLHAYETALSYQDRDNTGIEKISTLSDLFLSKNSLVIDDNAANDNDINEYLTIPEYDQKVKENFNENTVKLFNLKVLDIQFNTNYLVYTISVKKSIIGETTNGIFINRNIDLIFEIIRFYIDDRELLKIQKISSKKISRPENNKKKEPLLAGVTLYFSPGMSKIASNNDPTSSGEYSGFISKNDFSLKIGGNLLFNILSGKRMNYYVGTGIGYLSYKSSLSLSTYDNGYFDYDIDDDKYYKIVSGTNIEQSIKINYFEIPLFLQAKYHLNNFSLYLNTGIQIGIANSMHINTNQGQVNYKGQYSLVDDNGIAYNFVLENLDDYGFGSYSLSENDQSLEIDPINLSFLLSAGVTLPLNSSFQLMGGVDFVKGLSNINSQSEELISSDNINSVISSSTSFNTSFIGFKIGLQYNFNKPSKEPIIKDDEIVLQNYSTTYSYDSTDFSNEKRNNFSLPADYAGLNLFYIDLSDESVDRAKTKYLFENTIDSVLLQKGKYFAFMSNANKPIIAEPDEGYNDILKQFNFLTPELPDVYKDIDFILELLSAKKDSSEYNRINLFCYFSSSFYSYQSDVMINILKEYFEDKDIQIYIFLNKDENMNIEIEKYNYKFKYLNIGGE